MAISGLRTALLLLALLAPISGASAADKVLRVVPHADLKVLDPHTNTATITLMHGHMIYDTLFAWDFEAPAEASDGRELPDFSGPAGVYLYVAARPQIP